MPTLNLTDAAVKRIKAPSDASRVEYWDTSTLDGKPTGLGLRVSQTGTRSWVTIVRALKAGNWVQQRVTLGKYPALTLAEARKAAIEARTRAERGEDPGSVPREQRHEQVDNSRNTYAAVLSDFLARYRGRQNRRPAPRTIAEIQRVLKSDLFTDWGNRPLAEVRRRDVLDVLDLLMDRGVEVMANRTLAYLGMLFGWAMDREIIKSDPTDGIKKPGAEQSRDRVLTAAEMRAIWQATASTQTNKSELFASIVKVLMLTGQRREEVGAMRWVEIHDDTWYLPASRTKNHREHLVPLAEPVLAILAERREEQAAMGLATGYVFTSGIDHAGLRAKAPGPRPFSSWSQSKVRLDARAQIAPWTLHDLRRTLATRMAEDLHTPPHIIEAILNHVSGTRAGVAGTYNRALYQDERRAALNVWSAHVLHLVGETTTNNVVRFARV